ncbi:MAG: YdeI/OmpD-associated family protein [Chloroflexi bacterium]|nr:YdeI/OmpD-associated family protein [Chloroflexota bacterium]
MDITKTLYVTNRVEWRKWLKKNYKTKKEIWLVYYKKASGKPRIEYNDAVEEALCFGWIDSTVRKLDDERFAQRFTPRKPRSGYSPANKERLRKLISDGKVMKDVLVLLASLGDLSVEKFEIPADILRAVKANKEAWKNFQNFSDTYKRIRIGFIDGARNRPEEFQKRLNYFIKMTGKNRQFGFGGIEKHY